jgi:YD repeat-containing protein
MLKTLFLLGISLFMLVSCDQAGGQKRPVYENHKNDWERFNLRGKVKQVSYSSQATNINPTDTIPVILERYLLTFTEHGQLESLETYAINGQMKDRKTYSYNDKQQMIREVTLDANHAVFSETTYAYDADGNNHQKIQQLAEETYFHYFKYDSLGNPVHHLQVLGKDTLEAVITNTYDTKGHLIQSNHITTRDEGKNNMTISFVYDEHGNKTEETRARVGFELTRFIQTYDEQHRLISIQHTESGRLVEETRFDENFNPISNTRFGGTGESVTYSYTYTLDHKGNWTGRKTQMIRKFGSEEKENRSFSEETRTIIYFD